MQKYLKLAEQHVQWLAIGLGALYLFWMVWSYVLGSPVTATLGGKPVDPSKVDELIATGPIKTLVTAINTPPQSKMEPPDVVAPFMKVADEAGARLKQLPGVMDWLLGSSSGVEAVAPVTNTKLVQAIPVVPAAVPVAVAAYRTEVQYPDPQFVPPQNDPSAQAQLITKDLDATSVAFKIPMQPLAQAFTAALANTNQPSLFQTQVLQVTLYRQEQDRKGGWSPPTVVLPLAIHQLMPYPGDTAAAQAGLVYEAWAGEHTQDLAQPTFYPVAAGADPWFPPDQPPASSTSGASPAAPRPPGSFAPGGPAGPGPGRGQFPSAPGQFAPGRPPVNSELPAPPPGGNFAPPGGTFAPPGGNYVPPGGNFAPLAAVPLAVGAFDPRRSADMTLYAHDDTVQPGKTYRYFLQYKLLNPLYQTSRIALPNLTKTFALISPDPAHGAVPTEKISIPSRTQLYVKSIRSTEVRFAVFVWKPKPVESEVAATPGDMVGSTPWTVVDIRQDPKTREYYVLLVDQDGVMQRHDMRQDQSPLQDIHAKISGPSARAE